MNDSVLITQILVGQIQDGNRDALNELCERYMPRVLYAVRARLSKKLHQKLQSMDVLQDAMIDVVKGLGHFEFRSDGAFLNYVNRVIENNIRDQAGRFTAAKRDINREQPAVDDQQQQIDFSDFRSITSPSIKLAQLEELAVLEQAMDRLLVDNPEYHELIVRTQIEEQSYVEIAQETGQTPDAVRMKANRAQEALARHFSKLT